MSGNATLSLRGGCFAPFFDESKFPTTGGHIEGRFCKDLGPTTCCLPCPMTEYVYPDYFDTLTAIASWTSVVGSICSVFLLLSWLCLPVERTNRHYLSISVTVAIVIMNMGFIIPLATEPEQCFNEITPNDMHTSAVCAASGAFLVLGGFTGPMWVFLRSLSLHIQICWQVVVGRNFMLFSHAAGWLVPIVVVTITMVMSGVSFRFGPTCHINHKNSLADFWIPLLVVAALTMIVQFATFGYCIRVYLASLSDSSSSTEGSSLPTYSNSVRTMTPRQAYRRVRRVIALQWRGICIVLIIIMDVIFFSIIFVFQDNTVQDIQKNPEIAEPWLLCLVGAYAAKKDKNACLAESKKLVVNEATIMAVLLLLALNGVFLLFLLGRWAIFVGWWELIKSAKNRNKKEFVSVDARYDDLKKDQLKSPASPSTATTLGGGRRTPDYFGQTARYQPPVRSFSSPRPPQSPTWEAQRTHARPTGNFQDMNPLGMNRI